MDKQLIKQRTIFLQLIQSCTDEKILYFPIECMVDELGSDPLSFFLNNFYATNENYPLVEKMVIKLASFITKPQSNLLNENFLHVLFKRINSYPELGMEMVYKLFTCLKNTPVNKFELNFYDHYSWEPLFKTEVSSEWGGERSFTPDMAVDYYHYFFKDNKGLFLCKAPKNNFFVIFQSLSSHDSKEALWEMIKNFEWLSTEEKFTFFGSFFSSFRYNNLGLKDRKNVLLKLLDSYDISYENKKKVNLLHLLLINNSMNEDCHLFINLLNHYEIQHTPNILGTTPKQFVQQKIDFEVNPDELKKLKKLYKAVAQSEEVFLLRQNKNQQMGKSKIL